MNENAPSLTIVLADDHALVRGGLALLVKMLSGDIRVNETNDLDQTLACLAENQPVDLLLLDLLMPGMKGAESVKQICETWPDVPVVVVSVREDLAAISQALASGAVGYIPKTSSPKVTMSAVQLVLSGGIYVPPHVMRALTDKTPETEEEIPSSKRSEVTGPLASQPLTRRQQEVLALMAQGKSNKAIAVEMGLNPGTIKMHSSRIFKSLGVGNRTEAVAKFFQSKPSVKIDE